MEIQIPSPSVFLRRSPVPTASVPATVKKPAKPRGAAQSKSNTKSATTTGKTNAQAGGIAKPKQSKSRNGCMTCKKKRLKCDETKPTCTQCEKRAVECEGYKKDYKWRSFEETNKASKVGRTKKATTITFSSSADAPPPPQPANARAAHHEQETAHSSGLQHAFNSAQHAINTPPVPFHSPPTKPAPPPRRYSPSQFDPLPILNPGFSPTDLDLPSPFHRAANQFPEHFEPEDSRSSFASGSPGLQDLLLPGTDMHQPPDPSEPRPCMSPLPYQPGFEDDMMDQGLDTTEGEDFDEEIIRPSSRPQSPNMSEMRWSYRATSPAPSESSSASSGSTKLSILQDPAFEPASSEMLLLRFDRETCGILSVKDGPTENPWRNLIWPLAADSPTLSHAILSMAALHGSTRVPGLRLAGMAHMAKSVSTLATDIQSMSLEQGLATTLALALGEGWDERVSTGIQHLKGARIMLNGALIQHRNGGLRSHRNENDAKRLKFLCNTYVYMDVIARLASKEEQDDIDLEAIIQAVNEPYGPDSPMEIDPLMGCATTLFPIIGRVATLVNRIRRMRSNSLNIISQANDLREQLLSWEPPAIELVEQPEDHTSNARHAIATAEAYRRAILLHLHQAVPELVMDPSHEQAKNILGLLAGTPVSSRTMIVQIFPLLVGSCEMVTEEDRQWATFRWEAMMQRLSIVNVESCWKIVREVWHRRDMFVREQVRKLDGRPPSRKSSSRQFVPPTLKRKVATAEAYSEDVFFEGHDHNDESGQEVDEPPLKRRLTFDSSTGITFATAAGGRIVPVSRRPKSMTIANLDPEYTVRGALHWLGVMADWRWEVFVG